LIAAEAPKVNARRRIYLTTLLTEPEVATLASDIGAENDGVLTFPDEEKAAANTTPWWQQSPFGGALLKDPLVLDWIQICRWHFLETGNPIFAFRALNLARILSAQHSEALRAGS
jgi:hypothetical protein